MTDELSLSGDALGLRGKRIAVVGAASGIGAATAALLGELGADVVGLDVKQPDPGVPWVAVDLRDESSIRRAAAEVGRVDCLHSCAGLPQTADGLDVMLAGFVGPRLLIELVAAEMTAGSAIVCVASTVAWEWASDAHIYAELLALHDFDAAAAWCAAHVSAPADNYRLTKSAVIAYTAASAGRFAGRGLRINCVAPGPTLTPMTEQFTRDEPAQMAQVPLPMGRMADASEQAWVLAFLGSPRCSFVNGSTVFVDGGLIAGKASAALLGDGAA